MKEFLMWGLVPLGITAVLLMWVANTYNRLKGQSAPWGHIVGIQLVYFCLLPSAVCWAVWLVYGLVLWVN